MATLSPGHGDESPWASARSENIRESQSLWPLEKNSEASQEEQTPRGMAGHSFKYLTGWEHCSLTGLSSLLPKYWGRH